MSESNHKNIMMECKLNENHLNISTIEKWKYEEKNKIKFKIKNPRQEIK